MSPPPSTSVTPPPSPAPSRSPAIFVQPIDAPWTASLDRLLEGRDVAVAVGVGDRIVYVHDAGEPRIPASSEKLLTSMAALEIFGPAHRFRTVAASAARAVGGTLRGDLWLIGSGDPELTTPDLDRLAEAVAQSGIRRIRGDVVGDTATFDRGWWAPGWVPGLSRDFITRPTALALDGNHGSGPPEADASSALATALRAQGVVIEGAVGTGDAPASARAIAGVRSAPLAAILTRQNHGSVNFDAEMVTKALGFTQVGEGASTADGADAIAAWARSRGIRARVLDGSGLSHRDRIAAAGLVALLLGAAREPWGRVLERSLPSGGEGTLEGRLLGVPVHAKTGTLFEISVSALSGYVTGEDGTRVAFTVLSRGMSKGSAVSLEDSVVRLLAAQRLGSFD